MRGRPKGSKNKKPASDAPLANLPAKLADKSPDNYSVSLTVSGKDYTSNAGTLLEAIAGIKPEVLKTKGKLKIEKDGKVFERLLFIPQMRKIFGDYSSYTRQIALQSISKWFDQMLK